MDRIKAILQLLLAAIFYLIALAALVNMLLIAVRPETISVVNAFIGLTVLIVCFLALGRIMYRKGMIRFRTSGKAGSNESHQRR